ncbi:MAG: T9SS type A sorting domain-containing protein, partial [Saprospiraceae bacterium]|nr:T9SS type A sorting domain-containing protein [Saprospiraceae bacterium]
NDTFPSPGDRISYELFLRNDDKTDTVKTLSIEATCLQPYAKRFGFRSPKFDFLAPGEVKKGDATLRIEIADSCPTPIDLDFVLQVISETDTFWTDTFTVHVDIEPGEVVERSFMQDDSLRSYLLYVPATYDGSEPWPLVLNYHGFGVDAGFQMNYTEMNSTADTAHFLVAYPQGLIVEDLVFGGFGPGWNIPESYNSANDDIAFTNGLIDDVIKDYKIDLSHVHVTGWSNGGEMSFYVASELSDRVASVASVSNALNYFVAESLNVTRPISTLLIHGTEDPFFPFEGTPGHFLSPQATMTLWAEHNSCNTDSIVTAIPDINPDDNTFVYMKKYLGCERNTETIFYTINGGGHTWPGSTPIPGLEWLGNTNQDIDANSVIWNFFKRNPLIVGLEDENYSRVRTFQLEPNYPNPFNPETIIRYQLPEPANAKITIFDINGRHIKTLVNKQHTAGHYQVTFDASNLPSGIYFYELKTSSGFSQTKKMVVLK